MLAHEAAAFEVAAQRQARQAMTQMTAMAPVQQAAMASGLGGDGDDPIRTSKTIRRRRQTPLHLLIVRTEETEASRVTPRRDGVSNARRNLSDHSESRRNRDTCDPGATGSEVVPVATPESGLVDPQSVANLAQSMDPEGTPAGEAAVDENEPPAGSSPEQAGRWKSGPTDIATRRGRT